MPSEGGVTEQSISGSIPESVENQDKILLRRTGHKADVCFVKVWENEWEKKVGVLSKREYADVFSDELDWDKSHHRWNSDEVKDTDMWEVDLSALFYVASAFIDRDLDVTIAAEVFKEYYDEYGS